MQRELSVQAHEEAPKPPTGFTVAAATRFEERIIEWLCMPILVRIPPSVRPNSISLTTHFIAWITAALAVGSVQLPQPYRSLALVCAGIGMLLQMIGDCLDGMHARRTNQCSKLGEMMDHWLDANVVPLVTIGASMALEMDPWVIVGVNVTVAMVYHAQLVLYHHTGKFVHPETASGVEGQFGVSLGYVAIAALFYFVERQAAWLGVALATLGALAILVQLKCSAFYYVKPGFRMSRHLTFVAMGAGLGALYLSGAIGVHAFLFALVFTSFRISGSYVLFTIIKRPYDGNDLGIFAFIAAIAAAHVTMPGASVGGVALPTALTAAACAYMIGRNMVDFVRYYPALLPSPTTADAAVPPA